MSNQLYPSDLTDSPWEIIQALIPKAKCGGRPRSLALRQVINAILYVTVGGLQWRWLPKTYPKWQSVYRSFRQWRDDGTWRRIHNSLRAKMRRKQEGTNTQRRDVRIARVSKPAPSAAFVAMTVASRGRDVSVISSSIHSACCWRLS